MLLIDDLSFEVTFFLQNLHEYKMKCIFKAKFMMHKNPSALECKHPVTVAPIPSFKIFVTKFTVLS